MPASSKISETIPIHIFFPRDKRKALGFRVIEAVPRVKGSALSPADEAGPVKHSKERLGERITLSSIQLVTHGNFDGGACTMGCWRYVYAVISLLRIS